MNELESDTRQLVLSQLSGCEVALIFPDKDEANLAITHLSSCFDHGGAHHFAVFNEGRGVYMSKGGEKCISFLIDSYQITPENKEE